MRDVVIGTDSRIFPSLSQSVQPVRRRSRAIARKSNEAEEMLAIGIGSRGDKSSSLDAALSFDAIDANEIERKVRDDGKVIRWCGA